MKSLAQTRGFSLIEVMVAVLILGIALVGLVRGLTTALAGHKDSEQLTAAALMAAGRMEFLRADGILENGATEGAGGDGLSGYRWRQTISPAAIEGLKEVTVVVENAVSGVKIYELVTLLFEPPLDPLRDKTGVSSPAAKAREQRRRSR